MLKDVILNPFPHDTNCFEVKTKNDLKDNLTLCGCPFAANAGYTAGIWMSEITKFRDSCSNNPDGTITIGDNDKIQLNIGNETVELGGDQLRDLAKEAAMDHLKTDDQKADQDEEQKLSDTINRVESITADATSNEFFKEQLVENENQLKAKKDLEKLDRSIQKEAEK